MMGNKEIINIQDLFLNNLRKKKIISTVFLVNGVRIQGIIESFDNYCVVIISSDAQQLIYKHVISTILEGVSSFNK